MRKTTNLSDGLVGVAKLSSNGIPVCVGLGLEMLQNGKEEASVLVASHLLGGVLGGVLLGHCDFSRRCLSYL